MGVITWIENTWLAEMVRVSAYGYPVMITLHSLGLAIMVGLSVLLSLRVLGLYSAIPYTTLQRLLKIAWIGFIINFASGGSLFSANATAFIVDWVFLVKMAMVFLGAILVGTMQGMLRTALASGNPEQATGAGIKIIAGLTIVAFSVGMVFGRLVPYLPP